MSQYKRDCNGSLGRGGVLAPELPGRRGRAAREVLRSRPVSLTLFNLTGPPDGTVRPRDMQTKHVTVTRRSYRRTFEVMAIKKKGKIIYPLTRLSSFSRPCARHRNHCSGRIRYVVCSRANKHIHFRHYINGPHQTD